MNDITRVLSQIRQGDAAATEQLLPLVYEELRRLAAAKLAKEQPGQTLQATALVHEAYLKLVDADVQPQWNCRGHFFAAAAEAMRRILVDNARRKHSLKRGGRMQRQDVTIDRLAGPEASEHVLALDEALEKLARHNPAVAGLVKLRYFAGLTLGEAAAAIEISLRTANRYWTYAKAWLYQEMHEDG
jgi:RNA polymerase sigma factor (TIGR02999 family)